MVSVCSSEARRSTFQNVERLAEIKSKKRHIVAGEEHLQGQKGENLYYYNKTKALYYFLNTSFSIIYVFVPPFVPP